MEEYDVMSIVFPEPYDFSANSTLSMIYADVWSDEFWITVIDANGGEGGFGDGPPFDQMVLDDPSWNTFETDLNDWVGGDVDLSAITEIYIEKFGATELVTFRVQEIAIGK
jgi:hypothetical protein